MELSNFKDGTYPETQEQEHVLEQYKLYVASAEKASDRRNTVNTFYLTLTTSVAGVIGYVKTNSLANDEYLVLGLSISAILICIYWVNLLENYRKLNSGKFKVIHEIENLLPLKLFAFEWDKLGEGNDKKRYKKMSNVEKGIPFIFGALFLFVIIVEIYEMCCK
ncbi:hypothetical protein [Dokdonia sp.]|uniref:RipA family octameric membrane protein n=1 Tax=Dokdonia sp. TaxID=2024995 RepID=UPI003265C999